jgi:hypothetical protein
MVDGTFHQLEQETEAVPFNFGEKNSTTASFLLMESTRNSAGLSKESRNQPQIKRRNTVHGRKSVGRMWREPLES